MKKYSDPYEQILSRQQVMELNSQYRIFIFISYRDLKTMD